MEDAVRSSGIFWWSGPLSPISLVWAQGTGPRTLHVCQCLATHGQCRDPCLPGQAWAFLLSTCLSLSIKGLPPYFLLCDGPQLKRQPCLMSSVPKGTFYPWRPCDGLGREDPKPCCRLGARWVLLAPPEHEPYLLSTSVVRSHVHPHSDLLATNRETKTQRIDTSPEPAPEVRPGAAQTPEGRAHSLLGQCWALAWPCCQARALPGLPAGTITKHRKLEPAGRSCAGGLPTGSCCLKVDSLGDPVAGNGPHAAPPPPPCAALLSWWLWASPGQRGAGGR